MLAWQVFMKFMIYMAKGEEDQHIETMILGEKEAKQTSIRTESNAGVRIYLQLLNEPFNLTGQLQSNG